MQEQIYTNHPMSSSGTTPVVWSSVSDGLNFVVVGNVAMIDSVFLDASPSEIRHGKKLDPRPAVISNIERSLDEHADVWAELSRY